MADREHVIALVTKLEDRASRGFETTAVSAERMAARIERAGQRTNAAVARGALGGARPGILSDPRAFDVQINRLGAERAAMLAKAERLGVDRVGVVRGITRAADLNELAAAGRALETWSRKVQDASTRTKAAERGLIDPIGRLQSRMAAFATGFVSGIVLNAVFRIQEQIGQVLFGFNELANRAEELGRMRLTTGQSVEDLQVLGFIAEQTGASFQAVVTGSRFLARAIAADSPILRQLGVDTRNVDGSLRSVSEILPEIAAAFANSSDETSKLAVATKLFGRTGAELVPILELGREGLLKFQQQAERTGNIIDKENIAKLQALDATLDEIRAKWQGYILEIKLRVAKDVAALIGPEVDAEAKAIRARAEAQLAQRETEAAKTRFRQGGLGALFDDRPLVEYREELDKIIARHTAIAKGEVREFGRDDLPVLASRAQIEEDRVANSLAKSEADERSRDAAEKHRAAVEALTARLESSSLGVAKVEALANAFARGEESIDSLMLKLKGNETVVEGIVARGRLIAALTKEYGTQIDASGREWVFATALVDEHIASLRSTAEQVDAIKGKMQQLADVSATVTLKPLKEGETETLLNRMLRGRDPRNVEREAWIRGEKTVPVPEATLEAPRTELERFLEETEATALSTMAFFNAAWGSMTNSMDTAIDRWTERVIAFGGTFGHVIEAMVSEALKQFARLAIAKLFKAALAVTTGGGSEVIGAIVGAITGAGFLGARADTGTEASLALAAGLGGGDRGIRMTVSAPSLPIESARQREAGQSSSLEAMAGVPRGTPQRIQNIYIDALDTGTVLDRRRSPFGSLRLAEEADFEAGLV